MYRERQQYPTVTEEAGTWEDWPPDTSPEDYSNAEVAVLPAKPAGIPRAKAYRPTSPKNSAQTPQSRGETPTLLLGPAKVPEIAAPRPRSHAGRKVVLAFGALLLLAGASWYGHYWWTAGRYLVSTDDAYVGAKNATLSAKVTGYVSQVVVDDNAPVREGDVIARIDDGDYQLAVKTARDNVATQQATIERIGKQVLAQQAAVDQAAAQLMSAQAGATRAELELKRQQDLAAHSYASRQTLEQAQANRDQGHASVQAAQAALEAAQANVEVLKAQQVEAVRTLSQLQTALARAERDLSFTVVHAPFDGVIGNRAVQVGDLVQPGQRLASLVPLDAVYVDANFKETQLARLQPGQPVSIAVDAYSDRKLEGRVVSVAPASGSVFSLLPPDNATGNFTKIVQRLPVRIDVPASTAERGLLRPGMSVVVSVDTKAGAPTSDTAVAAATVGTPTR